MSAGKVALLCGNGLGIAGAVARELMDRGLRVAWHGACGPGPGLRVQELGGAVLEAGDLPLEAAGIEALLERLGGLDIVVNLLTPDRHTEAGQLSRYALDLYGRCRVLGDCLAGRGGGAIVNQFFLPTLFTDTELAPHVAAARGAVTGVTRSLCIGLGPRGVLVNGVAVGLIDLPETRDLSSQRVRGSATPLGRWASPGDVAKLVAFLALDNGYISGQMLILDGGLTAGINGT